MNESIENCYRMHIITSSFKTEFTRKSQVIIVQIWKLERVVEASEEKAQIIS
jgi:hypothetical protein